MILRYLLSNNLYYLKNVCFICFPLFYFNALCQDRPTPILTFDFDSHEIKENDHKIVPRPEGVTLTYDRFGNENSAIYLHGNNFSYLNLGCDKLLKPKAGTLSLWVKLDRKVFAGKGYESNPILVTKNSPKEDFYDAYNLFYDLKSGRFMVFSSKDSIEQAGVNSIDTVTFNRWYHLLVTYDNSHIALFVDGNLQLKTFKAFETYFDKNDSVVVGNGASRKNVRYMRGSVDDIQIFHRVLSEDEIKRVFESPNPSKYKKIVSEILKYGALILFFTLVIFVILFRNKRKLRKQKEHFELVNKISQLELKVVKAQMNPHFISNCLAAIQELILSNKIDKAGQYIAKFSFFLRQILNYSNKDFIRLSEEIEIIKLNIELEKLRFKNEFDFKIFVDDNLYINDVLIPALITQPFIENAVWHGLLQLHGQRTPELKINFLLRNRLPLIEIEDNGIGRDLQKAKNINSKGTELIFDKIESLNKLFNTTNYKLEIIDLFDPSKQQVGTKVLIQLDIVKE